MTVALTDVANQSKVIANSIEYKFIFHLHELLEIQLVLLEDT